MIYTQSNLSLYLINNILKNREEKWIRIIKKKTTTINNVIDNSPFKNSKIDLISIDIESHEYEALRNFNFEKYNTLGKNYFFFCSVSLSKD